MPQEVEGLSGRALEQTDGLVCAVLTPPAPRGLSRLLALCSPGTYSSREHLPLGVTGNRKGVSSSMDLRITHDPESGLKNTSGLLLSEGFSSFPETLAYFLPLLKSHPMGS